MKILQVVTYKSDDGAFGGPTRVAEAQCEALAALGHEVTLIAAAPVSQRQESLVDGYKLILLPAKTISKSLGFAGMFAKGMFKELLSLRKNVDVAHVHLARDLVSLPAAVMQIIFQNSLFVQTHGMIDKSKQLLAKPLDFLFTTRVLSQSKKVFTLTDLEDSEIKNLSTGARVQRVKNGVALKSRSWTESGSRDYVLFLARLHKRKRPVAFVEMAELILNQRPDTKFLVAGPDEGELEKTLSEINRLHLAKNVEVIGPVKPADTNSVLAKAKVFVLPSFGEIFPMTVIEAFNVSTPTVVTSDLGIAQACRDYKAALVTDGTPTQLAQAVLALLEDPVLNEQVVAGGHRYLENELDIAHVAKFLAAEYLS